MEADFYQTDLPQGKIEVMQWCYQCKKWIDIDVNCGHENPNEYGEMTLLDNEGKPIKYSWSSAIYVGVNK